MPFQAEDVARRRSGFKGFRLDNSISVTRLLARITQVPGSKFTLSLPPTEQISPAFILPIRSNLMAVIFWELAQIAQSFASTLASMVTCTLAAAEG